MKVDKSSRHSKITGDFAERLILYWLSKYKFECAYVDHVGVDIIARNPHDDELMGISVKSRSRNTGTEGTYVKIPSDNLVKLKQACEDFGCHPYFAIVVDESDTIYAYILRMKYLIGLFPPGETAVSWKMGEKWIEKYRRDRNILSFEFTTKTINWWGGNATEMHNGADSE